MLKELVYEQTPTGFRTRNFKVQSRRDFHPYPRAGERAFWQNIDPDLRRITLQAAERYRNFQYPMMPASAYREYYISGDRAGYEALYDARRQALGTLVMAECIEGDGSRLTDIINGLWCICEESSWVLPAHNFIYEPEAINGERTLPDPDLPTLDIFSGETAMLLSTACYLLGDQLDAIDPLICRRVRRELKRRVIDPFLTRYDYWWMGYSERRDLNNWAPWCIMNCITAVLFCEEEDGLRKRAVVRAMDMLETYLAGVAEDGGCDEGATYWGRSCGMLLEGFEMLYEATDGHIDIYGEPKMRNFANYIRKLFIAKNYVVNFADGAARCNPAAELLFTAGVRMEDAALADFGAYCFVWQTEHGMYAPHALNRAMLTLTQAPAMRLRRQAQPNFEARCLLPDLGILVSRETSDLEKGLFLCAKAGCNGDSHNHNDVGNFVVYWNGDPVLVDVGVEVYRRNFFSADRYKIWTMQSQYHNLPTINGQMQAPGAEYCASDVQFQTGETDSIAMELAGAYPAEAGVLSFRRTAALDRAASCVRISDSWQLKRAESLQFHLMTPNRPQTVEGGLCIETGGGKVLLQYDTDRFVMELETRRLTDAKLTASWGDEMNRITLTCRDLAEEGKAELVVRAAAKEMKGIHRV